MPLRRRKHRGATASSSLNRRRSPPPETSWARQRRPYRNRRHTKKIGILGVGTVGTTLGRHLSAEGHQVLIANGRATETLAEKVGRLDQPLIPATIDQLLDQAQTIALAMPWRNVRDALDRDIDWHGIFSSMPRTSS
ncbi:NAD(P)-binding domain-containing protein [Roseovarius indicus]|uniref:NAD(P)-binding domain-containing protein n=1 Tax=Roseovarius indicus TaxID=540747 RepID=UPI0009E6C9AA